jgi:hypothetical protein
MITMAKKTKEEPTPEEMGYSTTARLDMLMEAEAEDQTATDLETIECDLYEDCKCETRRILLITLCKGARGCCGGGGGDKKKYAVLVIEGTTDTGWTLVSATRQTGNVLELAKECKGEGLWKGTVFNMGLHEDIDFMAQLRTKYPKHLKDGCEVTTC